MSKTGFLQLFPKNFICAEKNFICAERQTDKQTNKQTDTLNRVANTCRSANLTVASRQKLFGTEKTLKFGLKNTL